MGFNANKPLTDQEISDTINKAVADSEGAGNTTTTEQQTQTTQQAATTQQATGTAKPPAGTPPAATTTPKSPEGAGATDEEDDADDLRAALDALEDPTKEPKPNAKGVVEIPLKSLNRRITRAKKSVLLEAFGTDDREAIKKFVAEHAEWAKEREEARLASLKTEERLKEEATKAKAEADKERKLRLDKENEIVVAEYNRKLERIADKHVDADYVNYSLEQLSKHYLALSPDEQASFGEKESEAWIKRWVKEKPKFAKGSTTTSADEGEGEGDDRQADTKPEPRRVPAPNVGAPVIRKPPTVSTGASERTARPGQVNSMSREEVKALGKKFGVSM